MGPGASATKIDLKNAFKLGTMIAAQNWILLSGGRREGVMDAVNKGAKSVGGLTVGVIPTADNEDISEAVDISIITDNQSGKDLFAGLAPKLVKIVDSPFKAIETCKIILKVQ